MIPLEVRIKGLMRYHEEQVADFSDGKLIAICGDNGAGKSSIFDAITFALYGHSLRVNALQTQELISEGDDYLAVSFEFEEAGVRYHVVRERDRHRETEEHKKIAGRSAFLLSRQETEDGVWIQIPGTDSAAGLQAALGKIVKLSEQAFRSSYLLGQDAATAFIDLNASDRFKTVSGLIGLEEYESLAKAAREQALREQTVLRDRTDKLGVYDGVTFAALKELRAEAARALAEADLRTKAIGAARVRAADAQTYARLLDEVEALEARIEGAAQLIADKVATEADARRFEQTERLVAAVSKVADEVSLADEAGAAAVDARSMAEAIDVAELEKQAIAADEASGSAALALSNAQIAREAASTREREAHDFKTAALALIGARDRVATYETMTREHEGALAGLPALQAEAGRLTAVKEALIPLAEWRSALEQLETLVTLDPMAAKTRLEAQTCELEARLTAVEGDISTLTGEAEIATEETSRVRAELAGLEAHLAQRVESSEEAVCSHCGQPIDPKRAQAEIEELRCRVETEQRRLAEAEASRTEAQSALRTAREALRAHQDAIGALRGELATASLRVEQFEAAKATATSRGAAFWKGAPDGLRSQVGKESGAATIAIVLKNQAAVPAKALAAQQEVQALLGRQGELASARRELGEAQLALDAATSRLGDRASETDGAAEAYDAAKQALACAETALGDARSGADEATKARDEARATRQRAVEERTKLEAEAAQHETRSKGHRRTAKLLAGALDGPVAAAALEDAVAVLAGLESERSRLSDAPERLARLRHAESEHAHLSGERVATLAQAESVPETHRVAVDVAAEDLRTAETRASAAAEEAMEAESNARLTEELLARKQELEAERGRAERRLRLFRKLNTLLGRGGLQGVLVTSALDRITSDANSFLDRLTGGSLQLQLDRSERNDELELRAIDASAMRSARNIQALSGSQKFRCAVALAFGIGQYAGAGGMRSIMIDEGFGGLDESGQRQMVEELKNLSTHMDKVIVVSHLEAFRDRDNFPHQIHVEKRGNASVIRSIGTI